MKTKGETEGETLMDREAPRGNLGNLQEPPRDLGGGGTRYNTINCSYGLAKGHHVRLARRNDLGGTETRYNTINCSYRNAIGYA